MRRPPYATGPTILSVGALTITFMRAQSWVRTGLRVAASAGVLAGGWHLRALDDSGAGMGPTGMPPWRRGEVPGVIEVGALDPTAVAAIAIVAAGLVVGRWRPLVGYAVTVVGMIAYGVAGGPGLALIIPGMFAAVMLLRSLPAVRGWPWLLALPIALWSSWWDQPWLGLADARTAWFLLTGTTWMILPSVFVLLGLMRRRAAVAAREEELRRVAHEERLRVVRDIHDIVGHSLSMISLQSAVALRVLDADPGQAHASLEAIRGSSKDALAELRAALGVFREEDAALAPTPTVATIAKVVEEVRAGGVRVDLEPLPDAAGVSVAAQTVAHRVVQESLTNAIRHAPGSAVRVAVARDPDALVVTVANDRPAAGPISEGGGLGGMRSRVAALGGRLDVLPGPERFTVIATLPTGPSALARPAPPDPVPTRPARRQEPP